MNIVTKFKNTLAKWEFDKAHAKIAKYKNIDGWLTEQEAYGLFCIAKKIGKGSKVVEIGSWKGKSTFCISRGLERGIIYCIDPFNADGEPESKIIYEGRIGEKTLLEEFKSNLADVPLGVKINILQGYSKDFVGKLPDIDFLFIDGDHSIEGCKYDYQNFSKNLNIGGYLAFHDYYSDREDLGPTWVVDNIVKNSTSYIPFGIYDSLNVFKKVE